MDGETVVGFHLRAWRTASGWAMDMAVTRTGFGAQEWVAVYRGPMPTPLLEGRSNAESASSIWFYATMARYLAERRRVKR